jgi:iron complex transport system substrate-binding protein
MSPSISEILFKLNLDQKIVGVTKFCNKITIIKQKTTIGGLIDPQLEIILSLKPDLIITPPSSSIYSFIKELENKNINIIFGYIETMHEIFECILKIGNVTEKNNLAQKILKCCKKNIKYFKNSLITKNSSLVNILLIVSVNEIIVAGHNTFAANLVKYMGANYQANKSYNTWPILTIEKLLRNTPDIIIVTQGSVALKQLKIKLAPVLNLKKFKYCKLLASKNEILTRPGIYIYEDAKIVQTLIDNNR